jgi:hypothetical protein
MLLRILLVLLLVGLFLLVVVIPYAKSTVIATGRNQVNFTRVFDETKVNPW